MAVYFLQVGMKGEARRYRAFLDLLSAAGASPVLDDSWVFDAEHSVEEMIKIIAAELDQQDQFFLIEIPQKSRWAAVRLDRRFTDWMRDKRP
jgi:hypothetical protein